MFVGLADAILWFHVGVVLFNVFGLVVVPLVPGVDGNPSGFSGGKPCTLQCWP
jgi:hypothetical protein